MADADDEAVLRPVAGVNEIQVVGALSETVVSTMGFKSSARSVLLHGRGADHIVTARGLDAEFVLEHMSHTVLRPHLAGIALGDRNRLHLVRRIDSADRWLHLVLKHVGAARAQTGRDELWINTGYPLGSRSLKRLGTKVTLWHVEDLEQG